VCVGVCVCMGDSHCDDRTSLLQRVTSYSAVTQLATLTDHIPVAITFNIDHDRFSKKRNI